MTGLARIDAAALVDQLAAVAGVTALYRARPVSGALLDAMTPGRGDAVRELAVEADEIGVRIGIDGTRSASEVGGDVHRTIERHLARHHPGVSPRIRIEISTIR